MLDLNGAVATVTKYILEMGLYSFQSLSDETQERLEKSYGTDFGSKVDAQLSL
jgi:hypothetical protein